LSRAMARALAAGSARPLVEGSAFPVEDALFAARVHGVSALLEALPDSTELLPELVAGLREDRARLAARADRLREDAERLASLAERAGLSFVPLKGTYLATERYADPALRPCADIDLLAKGGEMEAWSRVLVEAGYAAGPDSGKDVLFSRPGERTPDSFAEHPDNPRPVELHRRLETRLLGRVVDLTGAYLAGLSAATLYGRPALLPDDDTLALHLLVHAGPDLVGRGLRLVQLQDFRVLNPGPEFAARAGALLGEAAWGLAALSERTLPGTFSEAVLAGFERFAPSARRRRVWLSRPGLMTGEEETRVLLAAEAPLCRTPLDLLRRAVHALPQRAFLDRAYGERGTVARLARYYRDRFTTSR
jgi:hypothetical protein